MRRNDCFCFWHYNFIANGEIAAAAEAPHFFPTYCKCFYLTAVWKKEIFSWKKFFQRVLITRPASKIHSLFSQLYCLLPLVFSHWPQRIKIFGCRSFVYRARVQNDVWWSLSVFCDGWWKIINKFILPKHSEVRILYKRIFQFIWVRLKAHAKVGRKYFFMYPPRKGGHLVKRQCFHTNCHFSTSNHSDIIIIRCNERRMKERRRICNYYYSFILFEKIHRNVSVSFVPDERANIKLYDLFLWNVSGLCLTT